jgi:hypothetical protein
MPLPGLPDMANELVLAQRIRSEAPNAMSPRGARRLIQIMPAAAMASGLAHFQALRLRKAAPKMREAWRNIWPAA